MADYIYTVSKIKFYPLNPDIEDISVSDIAHALSMISRANGHFAEFHSVAQHCIECACEAMARELEPKVCLACLLHDGAEAYMSDITTPVKEKLSDYMEYEENLITLIYQKYVGELTDKQKEMVRRIDKDLLYYEFYHYTGIELSSKPPIKSQPDFRFRDFAEVRDEYLALFKKLTELSGGTYVR